MTGELLVDHGSGHGGFSMILTKSGLPLATRPQQPHRTSSAGRIVVTGVADAGAFANGVVPVKKGICHRQPESPRLGNCRRSVSIT